jgi:glutathione synthase
MRILVIMDPPETVLVDADTSFALMEAAAERGHRVDHCLITDLFFAGGAVHARLRQATMRRDPARPITLGVAETAPLSAIDVVLVRKDPPFDANYLWATQLLDHATSTLVVNSPRGLRDANEKLYATFFTSVMPETIVSSDPAQILAFCREMGGQVVIKPLSGAGGDGVFLLREDDLNANAIIETVTQVGRRVAMIQRFLPEVKHGDKRILLLDGEPLGAILRVPKHGDVRSNIHVGGSVVRAELDDRDREIIAALAPRLRADGLVFVGLDVIGGRLTEVNVTSPTGIQQMSRLDHQPYSERVIAWLERRRG